jgi:hypothetical protein
MADLEKARTRSVDNLQRLYTVVISLAVTESLRRLLSALMEADPSKRPDYTSWLMFAALLVTIIPFYHGANRYLDATYVTGERKARAPALMIDFVMLFLEGLIFFALAMLVGRAAHFYTGLACVFILDAVWVGFTRITSSGSNDTAPSYVVWAIVNVVAAVIMMLSFWSNILNFSFWSTEQARQIAALTIALLRTVYDYSSVWSFYYPESGSSGLIPAPLPAPPPKG